MKSFNLAGKVALVTGGNGGVGLGMARDAIGRTCHISTILVCVRCSSPWISISLRALQRQWTVMQ